MKKKSMLLSFGATLLFTSIMGPSISVAAAESDQQILVSEGPGYKIFANSPNAKKPKNNPTIGALSSLLCKSSFDTTYTCAGADQMQYSDNYLKIENVLTNTNKRTTFGDDTLTVDGRMRSTWPGMNPSLADQIISKPTQIINATEVASGVGVPAGFSWQNAGTSLVVNWSEVTLTNKWDVSYDWNPYNVKTSGGFDSVQSTAQTSWVFGGQILGQSQVIEMEFGF
jgi:hypothetical protein